LLGWSPQTKLDDGLAKTVEWYRQAVSCRTQQQSRNSRFLQRCSEQLNIPDDSPKH
jgi:dTDP-D-glucose 4,6-dehydratase